MRDILYRIQHGWNIRRVLYAALGLYAVYNGVTTHQWILLPLGLYFLAMGVLALGCAGGNCQVPTPPASKSNLHYPENHK